MVTRLSGFDSFVHNAIIYRSSPKDVLGTLQKNSLVGDSYSRNKKTADAIASTVERKFSRSDFSLAAAHAVPAIVAEVAVAITHRDATAVIATWGVDLESCELISLAVSLAFCSSRGIFGLGGIANVG